MDVEMHIESDVFLSESGYTSNMFWMAEQASPTRASTLPEVAGRTDEGLAITQFLLDLYSIAPVALGR